MSKHTPGPWAYHKWGAPGSGARFGIETADHRHGLASITPNENASTLLTMEQHEANAHLIAAAPDLLDALLTFMALDPPIVGSEARYIAAQEFQEVRSKARAAIAKARGTT